MLSREHVLSAPISSSPVTNIVGGCSLVSIQYLFHFSDIPGTHYVGTWADRHGGCQKEKP